MTNKQHGGVSLLEVGSEALILEHCKTELFSALLTKMPVGTKQDQ